MWPLLFAQVLLEMFHWVPFWTVTLRCLRAAHKRLVASMAVRLLKRAKPSGAQGKAQRLLAGSLVWASSSSPCPPCWSRRIVAQYLCGHRTRRIMRTYHAVSQGSNWTRSEQPDAADTAGTLIEASHPCAAPPAEAAARRRRGTLAAGKHVLGPPVARAATAVLGANIPRAKPGNIVSMHWSSTCEGLTRGDLGCAGHLQPDESLFG